MIRNDYASYTWQELERKGDKYWEQAFWVGTLDESVGLRSEAGTCYENALGKVLAETPKSMDTIRLRRKVATFYRKHKRETKDARDELHAGLEALEKLPDSVGRDLEQVRLELELAFCDHWDGEVLSLLQRVEAIIRAFKRAPLYGHPEVWPILGNAYLLLGVALDRREGTQSSAAKTPEESWSKAENCFNRVPGHPESKRGLHDVIINRALHFQRRGNYATSIERLESIVKDVTLERVLQVRQNLAIAYLEKGSFEEAVALARSSLAQAERIRDTIGQIRVREVLLKAMKEQIAASDAGTERPRLLEEAEEFYHQSLEFTELPKLDNREAVAARLELHRVMAEIYLVADEVEKARQRFQKAIEVMYTTDRSLPQDDKLDLRVTEALIDQRGGKLDLAMEKLTEAREFYHVHGRLRKQIGVDLQRASILKQKGAWSDARTVLEEARGTAQGLKRQREVDRINDLLREIEDLEREESERATVRIFLSYAREDEDRVANLYQRLSAEGFRPWMDKRDILPGEQWSSSIRRAIRRSDFFVACLSANSIDKRGWIQREIKQALDILQEMFGSDIYLIPVRLEDCAVPEGLTEFQWVDLFEEDGWTRLLKAIQVGMERRGEVVKPT